MPEGHLSCLNKGRSGIVRSRLAYIVRDAYCGGFRSSSSDRQRERSNRSSCSFSYFTTLSNGRLCRWSESWSNMNLLD
ncbi:hypothetical protein ANANG_G00141010 [Anguilla anguilla]|uniref:Uncharacterized protein n=1 Tax=Anguilla anguilla TaxID=7936 RepID=A0A9D3MCF3_ANGAN|nr:hypothetical protein ANANG_G00141010 [Anguilla anguilla]